MYKMAERRRQMDATKEAWEKHKELLKMFKGNFKMGKSNSDPVKVEIGQKKLDEEYDRVLDSYVGASTTASLFKVQK
jgi:hypothetical protein